MGNRYQVYQFKVRRYPFINYCYLVVDVATKQCLLIDPAWEPVTIEQAIANLGVDLVYVLLTHSHKDHVDLAEWFAVGHHAEVCMLHEEISYYRFSCTNLKSLQDGERLWLGETEIRTLHTPGHTIGSACYLLEDCLFTGDTIFIEGCGTCDTDGGDASAMYDSIQRIKREVPPRARIYPGHSYGKEPGYPLSYLLQNNIYFQISNKEQLVKFRMRRNQDHLLHFK
ncbi:MBL fold metallo-hydrolase [Paenibacillaceae sp. P-4]|uniref:MBL fold metallo-hydrolase n=1 Tax=Paenibacillaceae bacterium P-4 TaxID=3160969 RepID=UPI0032E82DB9